MRNTEGLVFARTCMVLSCFSPLFLLWAIRGAGEALDDKIWVSACLILIAAPALILGFRILIAKKRNDTRAFVVKKVESKRDEIFVYLFAMLIPLYDANLHSQREVIAVTVALIIVLYTFWKFNLYYINIVFSLFGLNVLTVEVASTAEDAKTIILLSPKKALADGVTISAYRISNSLFLEKVIV